MKRRASALLFSFKAVDKLLLVDIVSHLAPRTSHLAPRTSHLAPRTSHLAPRIMVVLIVVILYLRSLIMLLPFLVADSYYRVLVVDIVLASGKRFALTVGIVLAAVVVGGLFGLIA
ncbi:hypothetical protein C0W59_02370 [Photobacterium kishitanii]|nr:hypothetical protein C0W59_02370 [Photobacterium kishitanii]